MDETLNRFSPRLNGGGFDDDQIHDICNLFGLVYMESRALMGMGLRDSYKRAKDSIDRMFVGNPSSYLK